MEGKVYDLRSYKGELMPYMGRSLSLQRLPSERYGNASPEIACTRKIGVRSDEASPWICKRASMASVSWRDLTMGLANLSETRRRATSYEHIRRSSISALLAALLAIT